MKTSPRSVTAAASASLSSPSPLVSQLATHSVFTDGSTKEIRGEIATVTVHWADRLVPSAVVAVIIAEPLETAVTTPLLLTVATAVLLLVHVTFLFEALEGVTEAVSVAVWPEAVSVSVVLSSVIPVAGTGMATVTAHVAVRFVPSAVFTVMVAVPLALAVTTPVLLTVATAVLLLVHVTVLFEVLEGVTVAVSVAVWPAALNDKVVWFSEMPVAGTGMATVTAHVAVKFVPSTVFAVIVALPLDLAVTTPVLLTVATAVLLLVHVTFLFEALEGVTVAVSVAVCPAAVRLRVVLLNEMPVAYTP